MAPLRVAIVHARESPSYERWVAHLAARLRGNGLEIWTCAGPDLAVVPFSDDLAIASLDPDPESPRIRRVDELVVLLSPACRTWFDGDTVLARGLSILGRSRWVPVLAEGGWETWAAELLLNERPVDLTRCAGFDAQYSLLLRILGARRAVKRGAAPQGSGRTASEDFELARPRLSRFEMLRKHRDLSVYLERVAKDGLEPGGAIAAASEGVGPILRNLAAELDRHAKDNVHVTTVAPRSVAPGARFLVRVVLHVPDFEVQAGAGRTAQKAAPTLALHEGTEVTLRLVEPDAGAFAIDEPEATLTWSPPSQQAEFRLRAAADLPHGTHDLRLEVWIAGVKLARCYVEIVAGPAPRHGEPPMLRQTPIPTSAFASYSRVDRVRVADRLDSVKAIGIDVFLDCLDIRQGERWQDVLERELLGREALLLFWSTAARASPWVEKEWRFALEHHGLDAILPNALDPPDLCPPPPELARLQFGSTLLDLRKLWDAEGRTRPEGGDQAIVTPGSR